MTDQQNDYMIMSSRDRSPASSLTPTDSLSIRQMEVIYAVARHGSVTEAARALGISQPAVSVIIQECNRITGVQLFERRQGRLQPTLETGALLPEIERVQTAMRRVRSLVKDYARSPRGNLRIAAVPVLADNLMPAAMQAAQRELADIGISIICRDYEDIPDLLDADRIDVGLSCSIIPSSSPDVIDLWSSDLVAVMSRTHPLAKRTTLGADDLIRHPLIAFNHNIPIGLAVEKVLDDSDLRPAVAVEVSQSSTAVAFARAGIGLSVVTPLGLAQLRRDGLEVKAISPPAVLWNQILLPKSGHLNQSIQRLIAALRRAVPQMRRIEAEIASAK